MNWRAFTTKGMIILKSKTFFLREQQPPRVIVRRRSRSAARTASSPVTCFANTHARLDGVAAIIAFVLYSLYPSVRLHFGFVCYSEILNVLWCVPLRAWCVRVPSLRVCLCACVRMCMCMCLCLCLFTFSHYSILFD